jgi:hypothetical protein
MVQKKTADFSKDKVGRLSFAFGRVRSAKQLIGFGGYVEPVFVAPFGRFSPRAALATNVRGLLVCWL